MAPCTHAHLRFTSNEWIPDGYKQPSAEQIREILQLVEPAKKKQKTPTSTSSQAIAGLAHTQRPQDIRLPSEQTFPGPLVNEDDELYHDPHYPPQSLQEWMKEPARNAVTSRRRTIYVVPPPEIVEEVCFMREWTMPKVGRGKAATSGGSSPPRWKDVASYLQAFYHGLPVKVFENPRLRFGRWDDSKKSRSKSEAEMPSSVALETGNEAIRIRCRPSPDKLFTGQLNLNDVLDAAMSILPVDAYAILMLVDHDLYEDEEDDFCCGRAYGGSRVAVVSSARYRPNLDVRQGIDRGHSWPASHCGRAPEQSGRKSSRSAGDMTVSERYPGSAIATSVDAFNSLPRPTSRNDFSAVWLGRVCKTASHELGHCFGIDHCTYYACIMQSTASIAEDSRQPPYLCPVDLAKVLKATGAEEGEHYRALLDFCEQWADERMFAALAAWIGVRLQQGNMLP